MEDDAKWICHCFENRGCLKKAWGSIPPSSAKTINSFMDAFNTQLRKLQEAWSSFKVRLNFKKTVPLKGKANVNQIKKLIQAAENFEDKLLDYGYETLEENMRESLKNIINYSETPHLAFQEVWITFYNYTPKKYVENMIKLGYDGVIVIRQSNTKHAIVYNPKIIEFLESTKL